MSTKSNLTKSQMITLAMMCRSNFRRTLNQRIKMYRSGKVFRPEPGRVDVVLLKLENLAQMEVILCEQANTMPHMQGAHRRVSKPLAISVPIPKVIGGKVVNLDEAIRCMQSHPLWRTSEEEATT